MTGQMYGRDRPDGPVRGSDHHRFTKSDQEPQQAEKIDPTAIDEVAEDLDISDEDIEQAQDSGKSDAQK
jgi:hypothetical protein